MVETKPCVESSELQLLLPASESSGFLPISLIVCFIARLHPIRYIHALGQASLCLLEVDKVFFLMKCNYFSNLRALPNTLPSRPLPTFAPPLSSTLSKKRVVILGPVMVGWAGIARCWTVLNLACNLSNLAAARSVSCPDPAGRNMSTAADPWPGVLAATPR